MGGVHIRYRTLHRGISRYHLAVRRISSTGRRLTLLRGTTSTRRGHFRMVRGTLSTLHRRQSRLLGKGDTSRTRTIMTGERGRLARTLSKTQLKMRALRGHLLNLRKRVGRVTTAIKRLRRRRGGVRSPRRLPRVVGRRRGSGLGARHDLSTVRIHLLRRTGGGMATRLVTGRLTRGRLVTRH